MANHQIVYQFNFTGNLNNGLTQLTGNAMKATGAMSKLTGGIKNLANAGFVVTHAYRAFQKLSGVITDATKAYHMQMVAERQLEQVMRNTMGATEAEIQSIKDYASAQQRLGVIGDEVQLAGAKELATYITKTESLKKLLPMMNDMMAHQYGLNASQEQAVQTALMVGKVLDGQMGALSRAGYRFTEAEEKILQFGNEEQRVAKLSEIVTRYVGGMNAALANTPEGQLKNHANNMGDLKERVGGLIVTIRSALLPLRIHIAEVVEKIIAFFEANRAKITDIVTYIAHVSRTAFDALSGVLGGFLNVLSKTWKGLLAIAAAIALNNLYTRVSIGLRVVAIGVTNLLRAARTRENRETTKNTFSLRANSIAKSANAIATNVAALSAIVFAGAVKIATVAVKGLSAAIYNIPIIGWIAAIIAAVIALFVLLWDKCRWFRQLVFGIWGVIKAVVHNAGVFIGRVWNYVIKPVFMSWWFCVKLVFGLIWNVIKTVFNAVVAAAQFMWGVVVTAFTWVKDSIVNTFRSVWEWLKGIGTAIGDFITTWIVDPIVDAFNGLWGVIKKIFAWIADGLSFIFKPIMGLIKRLFSTDGMADAGAAFAEGAQAGGVHFDREKQREKGDESAFALPDVSPDAGSAIGLPTFDSAGDSAGDIATGGGNKVRNVMVNINKLVENITVSVTNLIESKEQIRAQVAEALLTAVNDVNLAN